jgi:hypothetical protein
MQRTIVISLPKQDLYMCACVTVHMFWFDNCFVKFWTIFIALQKQKKLTKRVIQWNTVNAMGIAGLNSKAKECISNKGDCIVKVVVWSITEKMQKYIRKRQ